MLGLYLGSALVGVVGFWLFWMLASVLTTLGAAAIIGAPNRFARLGAVTGVSASLAWLTGNTGIIFWVLTFAPVTIITIHRADKAIVRRRKARELERMLEPEEVKLTDLLHL